MIPNRYGSDKSKPAPYRAHHIQISSRQCASSYDAALYSHGLFSLPLVFRKSPNSSSPILIRTTPFQSPIFRLCGYLRRALVTAHTRSFRASRATRRPVSRPKREIFYSRKLASVGSATPKGRAPARLNLDVPSVIRITIPLDFPTKRSRLSPTI
jgi:hypothetical protein